MYFYFSRSGFRRVGILVSWGALLALLACSPSSVTTRESQLAPKASEDPNVLGPAFRAAADEFGVPVSVLEAIAYVETRWSAVQPEHTSESAATDTEHHLHVYGVMGLKNDDIFGRKLSRAAILIGQSPNALIQDSTLNIRGAAALLREFQDDRQASRTDPSAWYEAIRLYSGIADDADSDSYVNDVYNVLKTGVSGQGIEILPVKGLALPSFHVRQTTSLTAEPSAAGAPEAALAAGLTKPPVTWDPSPNYTPNGTTPKYIIIHDTEGAFSGAVSWLKNRSSGASAHYVIRSADGFTKQLVRDTDRAWHARCWNSSAIGIEHEGYVRKPQYFTEAMYQASAKLVRYLTAAYGIPRTQVRIIGHNAGEMSWFRQTGLTNCNDHGDPGPGWNWTKYLGYVNQTSTGGGDTGGGNESPAGSCRVLAGESAARCCTTDTTSAYFTDRDSPWCTAKDLKKFDSEACELASGPQAGRVWRCLSSLPAADEGSAPRGLCEVPTGQSASVLKRCCARNTNVAYFQARAKPWCPAGKTLKRYDTTDCDFRGTSGTGDGIIWKCE